MNTQPLSKRRTSGHRLLSLLIALAMLSPLLAASADEPADMNFVRKHTLAYQAEHGCDLETAALRVFSQYETLPVYITGCTFGGAEGYGNWGSNGGAISSIGVSWTILNSLFSHNRAVGHGANPAQPGTPEWDDLVSIDGVGTVMAGSLVAAFSRARSTAGAAPSTAWTRPHRRASGKLKLPIPQ